MTANLERRNPNVLSKDGLNDESVSMIKGREFILCFLQLLDDYDHPFHHIAYW